MTHRRWLEVRAPRGMVASLHALASASGVAALRAGGNALDAVRAPCTSGGGEASRAPENRRSRRARGSGSRPSGSCTLATPRALHAMPHHPITVSKRANSMPYETTGVVVKS